MQMGRALMGLLTLGGWFLVTNSSEFPRIERRLYKGRLYLDPFDRPSEKVVIKALNKHIPPEEVQYVVERIGMSAGFYVKDEETYSAIKDSLEKVGLTYHNDSFMPHEHGRNFWPQVFDRETGDYSSLSQRFDYCHTCEKTPPYLYADWGGDILCGACDRNTVFNSATISDTEFQKHVKKQNRLKAKAAAERAKGPDSVPLGVVIKGALDDDF